MTTHSLDPSPNGGKPHSCLYCQNEIIEPKSELWWNSTDSFHTDYKFSIDGTAALEAASNGCAFWGWYIRDFLDESRRMENRNYNPSQCSFEVGFEDYSKKDYGKMVYPRELSQIHLSRHAEYEGGSMVSSHGTFTIVADRGKSLIPLFHNRELTNRD